MRRFAIASAGITTSDTVARTISPTPIHAAPASTQDGSRTRTDGRPGSWRTRPSTWNAIPEDRLLGNETLGRIREAIAPLPPMQAEVIRLRDVLGWSAEEVCSLLDLTGANQRVLLHCARSRVRRELDAYLSSGSEGALRAQPPLS